MIIYHEHLLPYSISSIGQIIATNVEYPWTKESQDGVIIDVMGHNITLGKEWK